MIPMMMMIRPVALTATTATDRDHDRDRWKWLYIIYRTILLLYGRGVAQRIRYMWNIYIFSRAIKSSGKNQPVKKIVNQKKSSIKNKHSTQKFNHQKKATGQKKYIYLASGISVVKRRDRATVRLKPARTHVLSGRAPVALGRAPVAFGRAPVTFGIDPVAFCCFSRGYTPKTGR